jgi:hypothetical protein
LLLLGKISPAETEQTLQTIRRCQKRSGSWAPDGTDHVFATAMNILTLLLSPRDSIKSIRRAVAWLIEQKDAGGHWPSQPILRIPAPMTTRPATVRHWRRDELGTGVIIADDQHLFTAATALWALQIYRSVVRDGD